MFKARGTKIVAESRPVEPDLIEPTATVSLPDALPDATLDTRLPPVEDAGDLALALGMMPTMPELPGNFIDRVRLAHAGDLEAIAEMRRIGDQVPAHLQVAFAEMVEQMLARDFVNGAEHASEASQGHGC